MMHLTDDSSMSRITLSSLPTEVLDLCIVPYLRKVEQYRFFSLCKGWLPLLMDHRTMIIIKSQGHYGNYRNFHPHTIDWDEFRNYGNLRRKVKTILGYNDEFLGFRCYHTRRLQITVTMKEIMESRNDDQEILLRYVDRCSQIKIVECNFGSDKSLSYALPVVFENPTAIDIEDWLLSKVQIIFDYKGLSDLHLILESEINDIFLNDKYDKVDDGDDDGESDDDNVVVECPSLRLLKGVSRLFVYRSHERLSCYLEISSSSEMLQRIDIKAVDDINDISCLGGIPQVSLNNCKNISNIQPIAMANIVTINNCEGIKDISSFVRLSQLTLENMKLDDISMLGQVPTLVLRKCVICKYPVPLGGTQAWEFDSLNVNDLTGLDKLQTFTLINCNSVTDASMLCKVRYLTITECSQIVTFPIPSGRLQDWSYKDMDIAGIDMQCFQGLYLLQFHNCKFRYPVNEGVDLCNIQNLIFDHCELMTNIRSISNIDYLILRSCKQVNLSTFHNITNIKLFSISCDPQNIIRPDCKLQHLQIEYGPETLLFMKDIMGSLKSFVKRNISTYLPQYDFEIDSADESLRLLEVEHAKDQIVLIPQLIKSGESSIVTSNPITPLIPYHFDNYSIRVAVDLWCNDRSRAMVRYGDIEIWNVSDVTDMRQLFSGYHIFNNNLNKWNVSKVVNFCSIFSGASSFNQPLNTWDVSNAREMSYAFQYASSFNQPIDSWNVSNVRDMAWMFQYASSFNQPLNTWDVSNVRDMSSMFQYASSFDQPLNTWDVSNVRDMSLMFRYASLFNQPLNTWDVSNVRDMSLMFQYASSFDQPLNTWDVSNVRDMSSMFRTSTSFNQPLNSWNIQAVSEALSFMFYEATSFNQPLDNWIVDRNKCFTGMFTYASSFNQDLNSWQVASNADLQNMFTESGVVELPQWYDETRWKKYAELQHKYQVLMIK